MSMLGCVSLLCLCLCPCFHALYTRTCCPTAEIVKLDSFIVHSKEIRNARSLEHLMGNAGEAYLAGVRAWLAGRLCIDDLEQLGLPCFGLGEYSSKNIWDLALQFCQDADYEWGLNPNDLNGWLSLPARHLGTGRHTRTNT